MADIQTAVVRYTLPQVTGNFTVSIPSATWTPKAVIAFVSQTGGNIATTSVGMSDGTNQRALHVMAADAQTTTNTSRMASTTNFIKFYNSTGVLLLQVDAVGTGLGPGSGQWVFNVPAESTVFDREAVFIFFGGNDLQAAVESFKPNVTQNATATETVGFDPDLVFFATVGYGAEITPFEEDSRHAVLSLGAVHNNGGTPVQAMATYSNVDNVNPSVVTSSIFNNRAIGQVFNDAINWTGEITSFPANGFTMTTRDGATADDWVYYLALNVGGGDVSVNTWTWPDSTEDSVDYSITGVGFTPDLAVLITPLLSESSFSFNTAYGKGSVINVSAFDADARAGAVGMASNDNVSPTEESSFESDKPVYTVRANGTSIVTVNSFTFNSDGVTFPAADLTSTSSSGTYAWGFFVGDGVLATVRPFLIKPISRNSRVFMPTIAGDTFVSVSEPGPIQYKITMII